MTKKKEEKEEKKVEEVDPNSPVERAKRFKKDAEEAVAAVEKAIEDLNPMVLKRLPTFNRISGQYRSNKRAIHEELVRYCTRQDQVIAGERTGS